MENERIITSLNEKWLSTEQIKAVIKLENLDRKIGRFSKHEIEIIKERVALHLNENNITMEDFQTRIVDRDRKLPLNRIYPGFFCEIAQYLRGRTVYSVYTVIRRLFHPSSTDFEPFSKIEDQELLRLHSLYPSEWEVISRKMGKYPSHIRERYKTLQRHSSPINKGPWSLKEVKKLKNAVKAVKKRRKEIQDQDQESTQKRFAFWTLVAEMVGRNAHSCSDKWSSMKEKIKTWNWTLKKDRKLVKTIKKLKIDDESEMLWSQLVIKGAPFEGLSVHRLSSRWRTLKKRVDPHQSKSTHQIIDELIKSTKISIESPTPVK